MVSVLLSDAAVDEQVQIEGTATQLSETSAICVNRDSFVIPRLAGVNIETEYSVKDQRTVVAASQSLGFTAIDPGAKTATESAAVRIKIS